MCQADQVEGSRPALLWVSIAAAVVVLAGAVLTLVLIDDTTEGEPVARPAADVDAIKTETRDQAYPQFLEIFKDQPDLIDLARPEALPSSVQVKPDDGVSTAQLAAHLRAVFPAAEVRPIGCRNPVPTS